MRPVLMYSVMKITR